MAYAATCILNIAWHCSLEFVFVQLDSCKQPYMIFYVNIQGKYCEKGEYLFDNMCMLQF